MEWEEIYAYDADLKEYILDAKTEPDYPVMVVGINERSEINNQGSQGLLAKTTGITPFQFTLPHPQVANDEVVVQDIQIEDNCEPWYKGDAEVIAKQNLYDGWTTTVDMGSYDEGTYYGKNILIAWEGTNPVSNPYVKIYEDDYSSDDLMLNVATASITDEGWLNGPNAKITLKVGRNVLMDFSSFWFSIGD